MYGRNQHSTAIIFQLKINKLKKKRNGSHLLKKKQFKNHREEIHFTKGSESFPLSGRKEDQEHGALGFSSYPASAQHILCMVREILMVTAGQISGRESPKINVMMKG